MGLFDPKMIAVASCFLNQLEVCGVGNTISKYGQKMGSDEYLVGCHGVCEWCDDGPGNEVEDESEENGDW